MLQPYAYALPVPLHAPLGLISSAPLLERVFLSINDGEVFPDLFPVDDIHLDSLRDLDLVAGAALSRALPHFKAPRLKQLTLLLMVDVGVLTIADLLPSDSYPLLTEVTSMLFCPGSENSRIQLTGEDVEVTVIAHFPHTDNFFSTTPFSLTQITSLMLVTIAKPITTRICEFTNLGCLDLQCCEEEAEVFSDLSPLPGPGSLVPCPYLTTVNVSFDDPTTHVVDCFKQMVRSRKEAGKPLVTVTTYPL